MLSDQIATDDKEFTAKLFKKGESYNVGPLLLNAFESMKVIELIQEKKQLELTYEKKVISPVVENKVTKKTRVKKQ